MTLMHLRLIYVLPLAITSLSLSLQAESVPDKTVVLTFDDSVKSHRTFVAPLLEEYGFGATFFVTHLWMDDTNNFMTWADVGDLHEMGFEIGNHSWTHADFSSPKNACASHLIIRIDIIEVSAFVM